MSYDPLGEKSGSLGTPCCRTGFCVRRNKEPICGSQIRWIRASVLPIRRGDCCCSPEDRKLTVRMHARPFFKESLIISSAVAARSFVPTLRFETLEIHKVCLRISNLDLCQNPSSSTLAEITSDSLNAKTLAFRSNGQKASVSNVDFFRLTLAAPAYSMSTAIHSERKSRAFMILFLVFGKSGNRLIVCGAANLQRGVECIHNLQNAVHYQIPRRFSLIKRA